MSASVTAALRAYVNGEVDEDTLAALLDDVPVPCPTVEAFCDGVAPSKTPREYGFVFAVRALPPRVRP